MGNSDAAPIAVPNPNKTLLLAFAQVVACKQQVVCDVLQESDELQQQIQTGQQKLRKTQILLKQLERQMTHSVLSSKKETSGVQQMQVRSDLMSHVSNSYSGTVQVQSCFTADLW